MIVEGAVVIAPVAAAGPPDGRRCGGWREPGVIVALREPLRETIVAFAHRMVVQLIGSHLVLFIRLRVVVVSGPQIASSIEPAGQRSRV